MRLSFFKKSNIVWLATILILLVLSGVGDAGDHIGDYLGDQAPSDYSSATGFKKYAGYAVVAATLLYMARQIWKDFTKH